MVISLLEKAYGKFDCTLSVPTTLRSSPKIGTDTSDPLFGNGPGTKSLSERTFGT